MKEFPLANVTILLLVIVACGHSSIAHTEMPSCSAPTNHCQAGTSVPNRECNKLVLGKSLSTTSPHPHLSFPKPASGARSKSLIMAIRSSCHGLPSTTAVPRFSTRKSKVTTLRLSATAHSSHEHPSSSSARSIKTVSGIPSSYCSHSI